MEGCDGLTGPCSKSARGTAFSALLPHGRALSLKTEYWETPRGHCFDQSFSNRGTEIQTYSLCFHLASAWEHLSHHFCYNTRMDSARETRLGQLESYVWMNWLGQGIRVDTGPRGNHARVLFLDDYGQASSTEQKHDLWVLGLFWGWGTFWVLPRFIK